MPARQEWVGKRQRRPARLTRRPRRTPCDSTGWHFIAGYVLDLRGSFPDQRLRRHVAVVELVPGLRFRLYGPQNTRHFRLPLAPSGRWHNPCVAMHRTIIRADQIGIHHRWRHARCPLVTPPMCTRLLLASTPMFAFMPKYHWLPFFDERISGSRFARPFFVDGDAAISVASTMVPANSKRQASRSSETAAIPPSSTHAWRSGDAESSRWSSRQRLHASQAQTLRTRASSMMS